MEGATMRTQWIALVGVMFLAALLLSLTPFCGNPLFAQSGCCKTRSTLSTPWAKRPDLTFAACRDLNQQQDRGDNIFEPTGLVWWDRGCS
jgi:hypothetical protein